MSDAFIIMRKEHDSYRTLGPVARSWTLQEARKEIASLASRFPQQEFRMFADVGGTVRRDGVAVNLQTPNMERRPAANVAALRKKVRAA